MHRLRQILKALEYPNKHGYAHRQEALHKLPRREVAAQLLQVSRVATSQ
jgi:hypothetical protein